MQPAPKRTRILDLHPSSGPRSCELHHTFALIKQNSSLLQWTCKPHEVLKDRDANEIKAHDKLQLVFDATKQVFDIPLVQFHHDVQQFEDSVKLVNVGLLFKWKNGGTKQDRDKVVAVMSQVLLAVTARKNNGGHDLGKFTVTCEPLNPLSGAMGKFWDEQSSVNETFSLGVRVLMDCDRMMRAARGWAKKKKAAVVVAASSMCTIRIAFYLPVSARMPTPTTFHFNCTFYGNGEVYVHLRGGFDSLSEKMKDFIHPSEKKRMEQHRGKKLLGQPLLNWHARIDDFVKACEEDDA